ncbi:helix-turn-helix domain-containing protein [Gordonibacter massiliensis (ex Traore et al. 2017)]|uniref:Helix-turn-helix transcriptional regulator n=1 Tax=Gordonibacter massiliensis (ex Traore et al. 2017) TaxID=1841863 RepID=A0A842JBE6_9ACTN|nr:helix-turn-helix transcriptional regulator [Gordonibacter massiliensis (ex Traore et al. 2017)]
MKELRDERGLPQRAFAEASGLDRSYLAAIENGEINVGIKTVERIAAGFDISVEELFRGI